MRCPPQTPTEFRTWKEVLGPRKSARRNHSGPHGTDLAPGPARGADRHSTKKASKFLCHSSKCLLKTYCALGWATAVTTMDKVPALLVFPEHEEKSNNQISNPSINKQTNQQDPFNFSRVVWWHLQACASGRCLPRSHYSDRELGARVINGDSLSPGLATSQLILAHSSSLNWTWLRNHKRGEVSFFSPCFSQTSPPFFLITATPPIQDVQLEAP